MFCCHYIFLFLEGLILGLSYKLKPSTMQGIHVRESALVGYFGRIAFVITPMRLQSIVTS